MRPPSPKRLPAAVVASIVLPLVGSSTALAQRRPDEFRTGVETATRFSWYVDGIVAALVTLLIGGLLIAVMPDRTRRLTDRALERPGAAFGYGFVSLIAVFGLAFVLAITVIGIVLAIPLLLVYALVALVAGEVGYLAVGRLAADDWLPALGVAVVVAGVAGAVPVLGSLVGFVVGMIGIGTVLMALVERRRSGPR